MGSTVRARDVMRRAATLLNDRDFKRWTLDEMRRWINDGMREIASRKPDACSAFRVVEMAEGSLQSCPSDAVSLLRATRNVASADNPPIGRGAITPVSREIMDAVDPDWHDASVVSPTKRVQHVVYDEVDPTRYFVTPPNDGTGLIEIVVARYPESVPLPSVNPNLVDSFTTILDIEDVYANPLLDYLMHRCYAKDSQSPGAKVRSNDYWDAFVNALGGKAAAEAQNPNAST